MHILGQFTSQASNCETFCCSTENKPSKWLKTVDLICRISIGVFAAAIAPFYFTASLSIGLAVGSCYAGIRCWQQRSLLEKSEIKPVCAQGYMNFLADMQFSAEIGSVATAAFFGAHMRHDPQFYVPFCGFFLGFWAGRETITLAQDLSTRFFKPLEGKAQKKCCSISN